MDTDKGALAVNQPNAIVQPLQPLGDFNVGDPQVGQGQGGGVFGHTLERNCICRVVIDPVEIAVKGD